MLKNACSGSVVNLVATKSASSRQGKLDIFYHRPTKCYFQSDSDKWMQYRYARANIVLTANKVAIFVSAWLLGRLILCREGTADEEFCLSHVFSLTLAYNGAAMPCDCHPLGSYSNETCSTYAGECHCKPGTTGRRCDACDVQHYALSNEGCTREYTELYGYLHWSLFLNQRKSRRIIKTRDFGR